MKALKFRINPSKAVARKMQETLDACRFLYNAALQERRDAYRLNRISINYCSQARQLTEIREFDEETAAVYSQVSQDVLRRLNKAFDNFFRRVKAGQTPGFPRFKAANRSDSFTYPQQGFHLRGDKLILSKIGNCKVKVHRSVEGKIKTCTIERETNGWYVILTVEDSLQILPPTGKQIGIDVGLTKFATFSDEQTIDNPRFFRLEEKALAKAQRRLSKEAKGTKERRKRVKVVQKIHRRIKNRRNNFAHQESRKLVNNFDVICLENLNISNMMKTGRLSKSIADAAWNNMIQYTTYKAANAGRKVVLVNPRNTSQACSACGEIVRKDLSVRVHDCSTCGLKIDRDVNAARNILARGLASLGFALEAALL